MTKSGPPVLNNYIISVLPGAIFTYTLTISMSEFENICIFNLQLGQFVPKLYNWNFQVSVDSMPLY